MTLSPKLLKEFDTLIGEMKPADREQFRIELESTRNPDGRTMRSSNALLDRIIRDRPSEEQRAIKGRLVALSRAEKEETARIAAEAAANARAAAEAQTRAAAEAARVAAEAARAAAEAEAREAEIVGTAANTLTMLRHGNDQSSIATYILSNLNQPRGGRSRRRKKRRRTRTR